MFVVVLVATLVALTVYDLERKRCPQCFRGWAVFRTDEPNRSHPPSHRCWRCWRLYLKGK